MMHFFGPSSPNRKLVRRASTLLGRCSTIFLLLLLFLAPKLAAQITSIDGQGVGGGPVLPSSPDSVQGTVVNRVTRQPIPRALVYTGDNRYAILTDDRGHFEFKFPPQDKTPPPNPTSPNDAEAVQAMQRWYMRNSRPNAFTARKPGFLPSENGSRTSYSDAPHVGPILIELEPEGHIIGHVQLPDMESVEFGRIQLYRKEFEEGQASWRMVENLTIRANGEFRFSELPAGTYKLFTLEQMERIPAVFNSRDQLYGFPPVFYPNAKDFATGTPIHLAAGATIEGNISLVRREYYPVKIAVSNTTDGGYPSIAVYPQGHPGPGYELGYDSSEEAIRGMLPDGTYTLKVSTRTQHSSSGVMNFTVRGGPVEGLAVSLVPNISLAVSIKTDYQPEPSGSGREIQLGGGRNSRGQVSISLMPADNFGSGRPVFAGPNPASPDDDWTIPEIDPGSYWLRFGVQNNYVASARWGGTDLLRHPLTVGSDGAGTPIEVVLRDDGAELSGTVQVSRHENSPNANAAETSASHPFIYLLPASDSEGQFRVTTAMEGGQFGLNQIPPGTYRVLAFDTEQKELDPFNPVEMRKYESKGILLQLSANQKENLPTALTLADEP